MITGTLLRTVQLTPRMLRLTFAVPGVEPTKRPDDWLMIFFGEPGDHSDRRNYTVRAVRPEVEELDIDFALHEGGLAATWARAAQPGETLMWTPAEGGYVLPEDAEWQLVVGDLTAMPAIGRILEAVRPGVRTTVVIEVEDPADRQPLPGDIRWVRGRLNEVVRTFPEPDAPGYIWMAGETRHGSRRAPLPAARARRGQGPLVAHRLLAGPQRGVAGALQAARGRARRVVGARGGRGSRRRDDHGRVRGGFGARGAVEIREAI